MEGEFDFVLERTTCLDRGRVGELVTAANGGGDPPVALAQLSQARNALLEADFSIAVLAAASGLEIGLFQSLESTLAHLGKLGTKMMRRATLGTLVDWAEIDLMMHSGPFDAAGELLKVDLNKSVVALRNKVVHRGYRPSLSEADVAFRASTAVLRSVFSDDVRF